METVSLLLGLSNSRGIICLHFTSSYLVSTRLGVVVDGDGDVNCLWIEVLLIKHQPSKIIRNEHTILAYSHVVTLGDTTMTCQ